MSSLCLLKGADEFKMAIAVALLQTGVITTPFIQKDICEHHKKMPLDTTKTHPSIM